MEAQIIHILQLDVRTSKHRLMTSLLIICVVICIPLENCELSCLFAFTDGICFAYVLQYHGSIKLNFILFLSYLFVDNFTVSTVSYSV